MGICRSSTKRNPSQKTIILMMGAPQKGFPVILGDPFTIHIYIYTHRDRETS